MGSWSTYYEGEQNFDVSNIKPTLFTHLIYAFVTLSTNGEIEHVDKYADLEHKGGMMTKFVGLKSQHSQCKFLVSVGGSNATTSTHLREVSGSAEKRETFAKSAVKFLKAKGFDGLEIHWLTPEASDRDNFVLLLKRLREELNESGHILSVAVKPTKYSCDGYDITAITAHVDFITLLAFELHGTWEKVTGCHAPLFNSINSELNVDACVRFWTSEGASNEKIVLAIGTLGKTLKLKNPAENGLNAPIDGAGRAGLLTKLEGSLSYQEIVNSGWIKRWVDSQKACYTFNGDQWVTYEDPKSIEEKSEYVLDRNLGGIAFWSIEFDDFRNIAGLGEYPLVKAAKSIINV